MKVSENFKIENNKARQSKVFQSNAFWSIYIALPTLQILVNGKMFNSEKLYLGQEVILTPRLINNDGIELNFPLGNFSWVIEKPIFQQFYMSSDQAEGEVVEVQNLETRSIEFCIFDYDQAKISKDIQLECDLLGANTRLKSGVQTLNYVRPIIENPIDSPRPPIASQTLAGDWYLGYDKINYIGLELTHRVQNKTDIPYVFRCYQLIKMNCTRIIASGPVLLKEKLATNGDFWLDVSNPYTNKFITVPAKQNLPVFIYKDSPKVYLDDKHKVVKEVSADFEFRVVLMGAPVKEGQNASWVPLGELTHWGWSGSIKRELDGIWGSPVTMAGSCVFLLLSNENLSWLKKTIKYVIPTWVSEGR